MECPVEATPSPEISWFHGTEQIDFTKASNFRVSSDNKAKIKMWEIILQQF
jgi:hypothetical protein